jgi:hypothetical protein
MGSPATAFANVTVLVHWKRTNKFDRAAVDAVSSAKESWAEQVATGVTKAGDVGPLAAGDPG